jgi:hypothetical protein
MLTLAQTPEHPAAASAGPREEQVFPLRLFIFFFFFPLYSAAVTLFRREKCRDG